LKQKDTPDLIAPSANGKEHGDVARFVGDSHGKAPPECSAGHKGDQSDENRSYGVFPTSARGRAPCLFHPGCGGIALASRMLDSGAILGRQLWLDQAEFQHIDMSPAPATTGRRPGKRSTSFSS